MADFAEEPLAAYQAESCFTPEEQKIIDLLADGDKSIDDLALESNMESGALLGILMKLEMKFVILKNPDRTYRMR